MAGRSAGWHLLAALFSLPTVKEEVTKLCAEW